MQCACVTLCDEKEGMPEHALHIPSGYWIRAGSAEGSERILSVVIVKWVAFLNKSPQRGRDDYYGKEVGTPRRDIEIQINTNIYRNPATIASLWSEGLLDPTDFVKEHLAKIIRSSKKWHFL